MGLGRVPRVLKPNTGWLLPLLLLFAVGRGWTWQQRCSTLQQRQQQQVVAGAAPPATAVAANGSMKTGEAAGVEGAAAPNASK